MTATRDKWEEGLPEEVAFWEDWLAGRTRYAEDRALRLSSGRPFPWWAKPLIPGNPKRIRVLDVGAGPVTALGNVWEARTISIVPVDPLAREYDAVLGKYGITPPIRTRYGVGEKLVEQFGPESFDFAYACNCLDHALDPVECYRQMLAVLRPGCSLVTFHEANEAEHQNYAGLHQWNFSVRDNRLLVWNAGGETDVVAECELAGGFRIEAERQYIKMTLTRKT
ncbi:MAG TPA: methyltransferase domain-containing protein [Oceanipulchritudo sp.]|nr:methyltransferase domain-containing protein [Oceanipulchritudo sp.]